MNIVNAVHAWLCEYLTNLNVNYLGAKEDDVSIEASPGNHVVKKYIDGGELRQLPFTIALRDSFTDDVETNLAVPEFFENLQQWIEEKNRKGEMPLCDGVKPVSIRCTSQGYGVSNNQKTARYQMNCRFLYTVR